MKQSLVLLSVMMLGFAAGAAETTSAPAQPVSLEDQLKTLDVTNQIPAAANREKMYAVQSRYLPLKFKSEFSLGGGYNMTGDNFIRTEQFEVGYHFHFSDRWSLGLAHAWVDNKLTSAVDNVRTSSGSVPDVPFASARTDLMVEYNVLYGKFRWTPETVSYFDMYMALGPGMIRQNTGTTGAAVGDLGLAAWLGQWGSARLGLKDYYYRENYRTGAQTTHNLHAHVDVGYLF